MPFVYDLADLPDYTPPKICGSCVHFKQHYVLKEKNQFRPLWYGHCDVYLGKIQAPTDHCPNWTE